MACCVPYAIAAGGERVFEVEAARVKYGPGALRELGYEARAFGMRRVLAFTDKTVARLEWFDAATSSLRQAGCDVVVYDAVSVEPTDASFGDAAAFAASAKCDGYVSVGGGSTIDTCKAALLYATHPAPFLAYVNAPLGEGRQVPGALPPHIACPTTCGTGSEVTGIAICDVLGAGVKTGIASRRLRPSLAIVDPDCTRTLPEMVVACCGFDVLCHAVESYTAAPYTRRSHPAPGSRPMAQGANPYSDVACVEALTLAGTHLAAAVDGDPHARERMTYAATLAGIGFGNAGVHLPHAMSYALAGMVRDYRAPDYPNDEPLVPHGMAVALSAAAAFRFTAEGNPDRHRAAAKMLGAGSAAADGGDPGAALADRLVAIMRATSMPSGIAEVGFGTADAAALAAGAAKQRRLLDNAPRAVAEADLAGLFASALRY